MKKTFYHLFCYKKVVFKLRYIRLQKQRLLRLPYRIWMLRRQLMLFLFRPLHPLKQRSQILQLVPNLIQIFIQSNFHYFLLLNLPFSSPRRAIIRARSRKPPQRRTIYNHLFRLFPNNFTDRPLLFNFDSFQ